jgi:hypothetical protein
MRKIFRLGLVPLQGTMLALQKGQAVYFQGHWLCEVVADYGTSISYIPVNHGPRKRWSASKDLFTLKKEPARSAH